MSRRPSEKNTQCSGRDARDIGTLLIAAAARGAVSTAAMAGIPPNSDGEPRSDLQIRLARYRARVAAEGRNAALRSIDQAIDEERKRGAGEAPLSR